MSRPRVLVTGGSGFFGRHLLPALAEHYEPVVLDPAGDGPDTIAGDLRDDLAALRLPEGIEHVVHLAQSPVYRHFPERADDVFWVNVAGAWKVAELARRLAVRSLVVASSGSVYARSREPLAESSRRVADGEFYAHSKLAAELVVTPYRELFTVHLLRFFFLYGPGQADTMLVPRLYNRVRTGEPVMLAGDDGFFFNPLYVEDAAGVVLEVMARARSLTLNVAGRDVVSLRDLCERLGAIAGRAPEFDRVEPSEGNWIADTALLERELGACPTYLNEGLARTFC
jgi:nucleoside-diphosphate-sugar epimerase